MNSFKNPFLEKEMKALVSILLSLCCTAIASPKEITDPKLVQQAVVTAWGTPNLMDIQLGEYAYTEVTISFDGAIPRLSAYNNKSVTRLWETRGKRFFTLTDQTRKFYENGQWEDSRTDTDYKIPAQGAPENFLAKVPTGFEVIDDLYNVCVPTSRWNVKCSNLSTWTERVRAPDNIAGRPDCGGLKDCRLQKNVVSFDVEVSRRGDDGRMRKDAFTYIAKMSADVPYFSRMTDFCVSGFAEVVPYRETVPYTECQTVQDFLRH